MLSRKIRGGLARVAVALSAARLIQARRLASRRILVVDAFAPMPDRDAGSVRIAGVMRILKALGWHVFFASAEERSELRYVLKLQRDGIEVLPNRSLEALIKRYGSLIDAAWICRPGIAERLIPLLRQQGIRRIIYDTVDLHYLRLQREQQITGRDTGWMQMQQRELAIAEASTVTVVTSPYEASLLAGIQDRVRVVPVLARRASSRFERDGRNGILFVGNFTHTPNVDAVLHLCRHVLPRIREQRPDIRLRIVGNEPPKSVWALRSSGVSVEGRVPTLTPYFDETVLLVAPLRFGAGIKGKIVEALAHGVPVVTSTVGAEGIEASGGIAVADDIEEFSKRVIELYSDRERWLRAARAAWSSAERYTPERLRADVNNVLSVLG